MLSSLRRTCLWTLVALIGAPGVLLAQSGSGLALETNRYFSERGRALVEGALEIPYPLLSFHPNGEALQADAVVEVMIDRADGEQLYHAEREIHPEALNEDAAESDRVTSIETFAVYAPPGEYVARGRVTDTGSGRSYEVSTPLVVPEAPPVFSDVLMTNSVRKDVRLQDGSYLPYLIGTTMFNPNPRNVFYKDAPLVYFYYEVNPEATTVEEELGLRMSIRDGSDETVKDLGPRTIQIGEERNFDLGAFSVAGLQPGRYRLSLECSECPGAGAHSSDFEVKPAREQITFLTDPEQVPGSSASEQRYYTDYSPAQVDSVIEVTAVLLTSAQRRLVETLSTDGKIRFLNRFWDSVDSTPETPENEEKAAFEQRLAHVNTQFGTLQTPGWKTDRGRIWLLFGEPSERVDRPLEATVGPYVIWNYSNRGETFAFGDFSKDGRYRLIYSTHDEYHGDPTIQNLVDTNSGTNNPTFLRAWRGYEQVIEDIRTYRVRQGFQQ